MKLASQLIIGLLVLVFANQTQATEPEVVARWNFEGDLPSSLVLHGGVKRGLPGPRSPRFPSFSTENVAADFDGNGAYLSIDDPGANSKFDFQNDDEITVEAWVQATGLVENMYIVGKGRTQRSGPLSQNQNWSLRLRSQKGVACVNFLFHSQGNEEVQGDWHRWTSSSGFSSGPRWHHVAVSYKFGDPKSIRGFLDGKQIGGKWDMGGETTLPPVVDDDEVWIGSAMAGNPGNSFRGKIDDVAVYRGTIPPDQLKDRYQWVPPEIKRPQIPQDKVVVQLFEGLDSISRFPEYTEESSLEWEQDELAFVRMPYKYDSWGIRSDWGRPLLVRAWAEVNLQPGEYQLLIRSRGLARLLIDDKEVLRTAQQINRSGAHHVVDELPEVSVVGMRPHWMNDQEKQVRFESAGGTHRFRYEMLVGGPNYRVAVGEPCVAISQGGSMFHLVSSNFEFPLTDRGWFAFADKHDEMLTQLDLSNRQQLSRDQAAFWNRRHQWAKQELMATAKHSSIDGLIAARIAEVNRETQEESTAAAASDPKLEKHFNDNVRSILEAHCSRCHSDRKRAELSIFDRSNLIRGGESEIPSVVPGHPEESYLLELLSADLDDGRMPPKGDGLSDAEKETIREWIASGAAMPSRTVGVIEQTPIVDDYAFLRRIYIDTVGLPPSRHEIQRFFEEESTERRSHLIDRLLQDPRWADNWVGYWQDALAENPNLVKPMLNNSGPFRFWIKEALVDNKPVDRFATELMMMRGSTWGGGTAGFGIASQNDVPLAAKAHVIGSTFLGADLKCARCHDAPYHEWMQADLFQMAAMLGRKEIKLPESSTVPAAFFEKQVRKPLIEVTLRPGETVAPNWPFAYLASGLSADLMDDPNDTREQLASQVTSSRRFAEVIANRLWQRYMGIGLVEPIDDWESNPPSDPKLLSLLTDTLIGNDYDMKELSRAIFESDAYQRVAIARPAQKLHFFQGPYRRRMSAEQIVDSAFFVAGQEMETEPISLDIEGNYKNDKFVNFGRPKRSWEFTTLANERDRPSLALPRAQAVADVLKAFGWRNSRPEPHAKREETPNLIQPGSLANGTLGVWLTRLDDDSQLTQLMLQDVSVEQLVEDLFLRLLTRRPTSDEREEYIRLLSVGFSDRRVPVHQWGASFEPKRFRYVTWSNHLNTEANKIKMEMEKVARLGNPPTRFLRDDWRQRAEDAVWALLNGPEMIIIP